MRVAVIGLFNSGSSVLASILERLGFELGRPLWEPHFESRSLRAQLVDWWREPALVEDVAREHRLPFLRWWVEQQEARNPLVCAKHPLLCLSAADLDAAWGPDYRAIRAARPLPDAIAGLARRGWFPEPERMQQRLHFAAQRYLADKAHHAVDYDRLLADPEHEIRALLDWLELERPAAEVAAAAALVRRPPPRRVGPPFA